MLENSEYAPLPGVTCFSESHIHTLKYDICHVAQLLSHNGRVLKISCCQVTGVVKYDFMLSY